MKRGESGLSGLLAIDKPAGMTSHDVVNAVRRLTGERRVGHAGTLDPMATGLLLVCVGPATRLSTFLTGHDKSYIARIVFGVATDTDDAEGRVTTAYTKTEPGQGLVALAEVDPQELLAQMQGEQMQLPPAYSAIKKNGVTAYKAAREGKEIELEPRKVSIYSAKLLSTGFEDVALDDGNGGVFSSTLPYWDVALSVSKGTYIRSIARDLGQRLGCGAHLTALRRTNSGSLCVEDAVNLEELVALKENGATLPWVDPAAALEAPVVKLNEQQLKDVQNGRELRAGGTALPMGSLVSCVHAGKLMAVYQDAGGKLKPQAVIPGGVCGVRSAREHVAAGNGFATAWTWGEPWRGEPQPCVVAMGVFDGLHLGHRRLIADAYYAAVQEQVPLVVLTFDHDPDEFFRKGGEAQAAFKLQSNAQRLASLQAYAQELRQSQQNADGASAGACAPDARVIAIPTSAHTLQQSAGGFLAYMESVLAVKAFFVGEGFRFGAKVQGTTQMLGDWCASQGASLHEHALVQDAGAPVSSTRIRGLLLQTGDAQEACRLRGGEMHRIAGLVVHGRGEGADMGFATANLQLDGTNDGIIVPAEGVYAGYACVRLDDEHAIERPTMLPAAINMGVAKSFENATAQVEVHVLGLQGDIYGKVLDVWFAKRLRPQRKFEDQSELISTVTHDINWVQSNLEPLPAGAAIDPEGLAEY